MFFLSFLFVCWKIHISWVGGSTSRHSESSQGFFSTRIFSTRIFNANFTTVIVKAAKNFFHENPQMSQTTAVTAIQHQQPHSWNVRVTLWNRHTRIFTIFPIPKLLSFIWVWSSDNTSTNDHWIVWQSLHKSPSTTTSKAHFDGL